MGSNAQYCSNAMRVEKEKCEIHVRQSSRQSAFGAPKQRKKKKKKKKVKRKKAEPIGKQGRIESEVECKRFY
jgi:hypothetical protein